MSIPAIIIDSLNQYAEHNDYEAPEIIPRHDVDDADRVCLTLMSDMLGRAQVLFPADRFICPELLNNCMGRELKVVEQSDQNSLLSQYELNAIPAIPDITGIPTIVDNALQENTSEYAFVDIGLAKDLIRIKRSIFNKMLQKAQTGDFSVAIVSVNQHKDARKDEVDIVTALEKFTTIRVKQRIEDTLELPPLPESARDIIRLRANPDASSEELSTIVEKDPSLSAQVVSWASSSFYSTSGSVKSVHDAIVRVLGFDLVMNLSMGLSLGRTLNLPTDEPEGYLPYWQKALWMALGTTALIRKISPAYRPSYGMAYLSGLLHNFGYLVLAHIFPPHHALLCRYKEANAHVDPSILEAYCLDLTSEQVGSMLMNVWTLPDEVIVALRHQKNPDYDDEHAQYAKLLHITQYMLGKHGVIPQTIKKTPEDLFEFFSMSEEDADEALLPLFEAPEEVIGMAAMMKTGS
ncbi:MAG: HDOD domain-containing protein [Oleiphilaceae bacterium]|nr:HDOD domain-containing protein [Oleiphilaceae bacterium]